MSESSTLGSLCGGIWGDASLLGITSHILMQICVSPYTRASPASQPPVEARDGSCPLEEHWVTLCPHPNSLGQCYRHSPTVRPCPMLGAFSGHVSRMSKRNSSHTSTWVLRQHQQLPLASFPAQEQKPPPALPGNEYRGAKQNTVFPCVLGFSRRPPRNLSRAEKKKKKLKGQLIFLLQSLYSSFRCLGQERRRISLVSAPSLKYLSNLKPVLVSIG